MTFKKDDLVKQIIHPIEGIITSKRFNEDSDSFEYLVSYTDVSGNTTERWFTEAEIEAQ